MTKAKHFIFLFLITVFTGFSQVNSDNAVMEIKGTVKGMENFEPISGVDVSTSSGRYARTNALGEFKIRGSHK